MKNSDEQIRELISKLEKQGSKYLSTGNDDWKKRDKLTTSRVQVIAISKFDNGDNQSDTTCWMNNCGENIEFVLMPILTFYDGLIHNNHIRHSQIMHDAFQWESTKFEKGGHIRICHFHKYVAMDKISSIAKTSYWKIIWEDMSSFK